MEMLAYTAAVIVIGAVLFVAIYNLIEHFGGCGCCCKRTAQMNSATSWSSMTDSSNMDSASSSTRSQALDSSSQRTVSNASSHVTILMVLGKSPIDKDGLPSYEEAVSMPFPSYDRSRSVSTSNESVV